MNSEFVIDTSKIFTLFFLMIGPFGVLGPFAKMTQALSGVQARHLAYRAVGLSAIAVLVAGLGGRRIMEKWGVPPPVLLLTGGLIFFLVALQAVMKQYNKGEPAAQNEPLTPASIAFPNIVTPYGLACVMVLTSVAPSSSAILFILGAAFVLLLIDLVVMIFAKPILATVGVTSLNLLAVALGILQIALAVDIMIMAARMIERA